MRASPPHARAPLSLCDTTELVDSQTTCVQDNIRFWFTSRSYPHQGRDTGWSTTWSDLGGPIQPLVCDVATIYLIIHSSMQRYVAVMDHCTIVPPFDPNRLARKGNMCLLDMGPRSQPSRRVWGVCGWVLALNTRWNDCVGVTGRPGARQPPLQPPGVDRVCSHCSSIVNTLCAPRNAVFPSSKGLITCRALRRGASPLARVSRARCRAGRPGSRPVRPGSVSRPRW